MNENPKMEENVEFEIIYRSQFYILTFISKFNSQVSCYKMMKKMKCWSYHPLHQFRTFERIPAPSHNETVLLTTWTNSFEWLIGLTQKLSNFMWLILVILPSNSSEQVAVCKRIAVIFVRSCLFAGICQVLMS